ncbi:MAG: DUF4160 domain-containing protein [Candidatus Eremiobacteraeota bacterium]|nr:DUF4160 domain-containing protein [Candidatus Eremiobacteraeota bacterium]
MGSKRFDGVLFQIYPRDHPPRHVHARYGDAIAILEIDDEGVVRLAKRKDAIMPPNAKASDIRKILNTALANVEPLIELWEKMTL